MSSYILYELNHAPRAFTATPKPQFHIFNPRGKIVKNINFSSVSQNSDLSSKLNLARQQESRAMLSFQNKALTVKLLKFHVNQDNSTYLKKYNFQRKLVCQF